jgi:hypothetical protein
MTSLKTSNLVVLSLVAIASFSGCEKKKPPPPPPPAPVIIPPPPKIEVQALLQELKSDARVQFAESAAPTDRTLAEGAIRLADAIARGDDKALRGLLDRSGQVILDDLVGRSEWSPATGRIEAVRIAQITSAGPAAIVTTAIQEPGGAYILNWTAVPSGDRVMFVPMTAADGTKPRASDWDTAMVLARFEMPTDLPDLGPLNGPGRSPDAPGETPAGTGPTRKSTPGGPITIPGSPGGG